MPESVSGDPPAGAELRLVAAFLPGMSCRHDLVAGGDGDRRLDGQQY